MKESEVKTLEEQAALAERAAEASERFQISMQRLALVEASGAKARASILSQALEAETSSQMLDESREGVESSPLFGRLISGGEGWKPKLMIGKAS